MQCTATDRDGTQCKMQAITKGLCFSHSQLSHAEIFKWPAPEVEARIRCLTVKQVQALERVCNGETYEAAAVILGVTSGSFANRLSIARERAGMETIQQLIVLYAIWRTRKAGAGMP